MRKIIVTLTLVCFFSCSSEESNTQLKDGKYYAAHGFHDEYIVINNDSSYKHYVDGKFINRARWRFLQQRNKFSFDSFTELVNWETGILNINPSIGSRLFIYRSNGVLDAGLENMSYVHESLWNVKYHIRK